MKWRTRSKSCLLRRTTTESAGLPSIVYTDDFLSRYAPGGVSGVLQELKVERHFPGMQPVGRYPIHIIVKNGRVMLLGVVDNASDRQLAEVRAREVTGVFDVENS